jgi:RNA polymerase sigma-70 factor (ECF subfamily)
MSDAFNILAHEYRPMVLAYLRGLVADHNLAEDLAQETFLAAYQSLATFRVGGNFGAWLRGIARNKALMDRRTESRRRVVADSRIVAAMEEVYGVLDGPHPRAETWSLRLAVLRECIGRLALGLRSAVERVYGQGQDLDEAASTLGMSYKAVAKRLSRARMLLRECMASRLGGQPL